MKYKQYIFFSLLLFFSFGVCGCELALFSEDLVIGGELAEDAVISRAGLVADEATLPRAGIAEENTSWARTGAVEDANGEILTNSRLSGNERFYVRTITEDLTFKTKSETFQIDKGRDLLEIRSIPEDDVMFKFKIKDIKSFRIEWFEERPSYILYVLCILAGNKGDGNSTEVFHTHNKKLLCKYLKKLMKVVKVSKIDSDGVETTPLTYAYFDQMITNTNYFPPKYANVSSGKFFYKPTQITMKHLKASFNKTSNFNGYSDNRYSSRNPHLHYRSANRPKNTLHKSSGHNRNRMNKFHYRSTKNGRINTQNNSNQPQSSNWNANGNFSSSPPNYKVGTGSFYYPPVKK